MTEQRWPLWLVHCFGDSSQEPKHKYQNWLLWGLLFGWHVLAAGASHRLSGRLSPGTSSWLPLVGGGVAAVEQGRGFPPPLPAHLPPPHHPATPLVDAHTSGSAGPWMCTCPACMG